MTKKSIQIQANPIKVEKVYGSRAREGGGSDLVVEFTSGQRVILEFSAEQAPQVFFAGISGLPKIDLEIGMTGTQPVFEVSDFAVATGEEGDSALIIQFAGYGQVGAQLSVEKAEQLRCVLDVWLAALNSKPSGPVN